MANKILSKLGWRRFSGSHRQAAVLIVFVALLAPALALILTMRGEVVEADPDTFGYQPGGSPSTWQDTQNRITGSWFTPASSGTVTSITAYVKDAQTDYKYGIYRKSDNVRIGYTVAGEGPQGDDWRTLNIDSGGSVSAGVNYFLVAWADGAFAEVGYDSEAGKGAYDSETYGTWPDPWVPVSEDKKCWIYATYTPTPTLVYPTQPTLYLPSDGSTVHSDTTPRFEWTDGENADNHRLLIDNDSDFTSPEENRVLVTDNFYTITDDNALPVENYSWKVISVNENGENESLVWTFLIDGIYPTQPSPLAPENDSTVYENVPTFDWIEGDNADNHTLRVDNNSDFSSPEVEENGLTVETFTIADENALADGTYWWSITATNENGENASDNYTFTLMTSAPFTFGWEENGENSKNISYAPGWTPASIHSLCGEEAGAENIYAIDNDVDTFWVHAPEVAENHWIIFDLGENRTVTQIQIYNTRSINFGHYDVAVYVSENTVDWGNAVWEGQLKRTPAGWKSTGNFSKLGQFIKLLSRNDSDDPEGINEIKFYVDWPPSSKILGSKFKIKHIGGLADNITAYFQTGDNYPENMMAAIYSTGGTLIGQTNQLIFDNSVDENWRTFSFPSDNRPTLSRNTDYILVLWGNGDIYFTYEENASGLGYYVDENFASQFPSSVTFISNGNKQFSIYASVSYSGGLPENPVQSTPWHGEIVTDNTPPLETFKGFPWENTNMFRFLVDDNSDMLSPWIDVLTEPEWSSPYMANYFIQENEALSPGTWYWKAIPINPLYEKTNVPTEYFKIPGNAYVITSDATSITSTQATLNATITYSGVDNVNTHFQYKWKPENWFLENYVMPTDPATSGNWASRTPINYVAVAGSENENDANFVVDGTHDEVEIKKAIDNLNENFGEGTVYLFDGTYNIISRIILKNNISLIGESRDNTKLTGPAAVWYIVSVYANNVLIENLSVIGVESAWRGPTETNGISGIISQSKDVVIRNVYFQYFSYSAVNIEAANSSGWWVINSEIRDTGGPAIYIVKSENFYFDNNTIIRGGYGSGYIYGEPAIGVRGSKHGIIANNEIIDAGYHGIGVRKQIPFTSENVLIQNNSIENTGLRASGQAGVWISGVSGTIINDITIRQNRFFDNKENYTGYGVYFNNAYVENCVVDNNDFFYVENAWVEQGSGHVIENNVGATYENTTLEMTSENDYSKVLTGLENGRTYGFRGRIWFDSSSDDGVFKYFTTTLNDPPSVENLYITDMDNVAENDLAPQTQYKFWGEISDNETLADIENVTLVVYLDNENLPDAEENHYTFRWTREHLVDNGNKLNAGASYVGYMTSIENKTSIRFTAQSGDNLTVTQIRVRIEELLGTPPSHRFGIQADNNGTPSGSWLSSDNLAPTGTGWQVIDIPDLTLTAENVYHIVVEPESSPDGSNCFTLHELLYDITKIIPYDQRVDANQNSLFRGSEGWTVKNKDPLYVLDYADSTYRGQVYRDLDTHNIYENYYVGQRHVFSEDYTLSEVSLYLSDYNPSDNLYLVVNDRTTGENTEVLFIQPSVGGPCHWETRDVTDVELQSGHEYYFFLKSPLGTSDNYWQPNNARTYNGSPYTDLTYFGQSSYVVYSINGGASWTSYMYRDLIFYLTFGKPAFEEVGPDNTSPYTHLVIENCVLFDNTKIVDNIVFVIEFGENAQITANDNWDVWVQVYDSAGNEDNRFFLNQFDIVSGAPPPQEYERPVEQGFSITESAPRGAEFGRMIEQSFSFGAVVTIVMEVCRLLLQAFGFAGTVGVTSEWRKSLTQDFSLTGDVTANMERWGSIDQTFSLDDSVSTVAEHGRSVEQGFFVSATVEAVVDEFVQEYERSIEQSFSFTGSVEANKELDRNITQDFSLAESIMDGREIAINLSDALSLSATVTAPASFVRELGGSWSFTATVETQYRYVRAIAQEFSVSATVGIEIERLAREYERSIEQGFSIVGTIVAHEYGDIYVTSPWCDGRANPIDVVANPTFSAIYTVIDNNIPNPAQFIQIQVGTSLNDNDLWDNISAVTVENGQRSLNVSYDGMPLTLNSTYWWRCRLGDSNGNLTEWTSPQTFGYQEAPFDLVAAAMFILPIVLMVIAFAFDNVVFASFAGIVFILSGLFFVDVIWLAMIFVGVGIYLLIAAFLSEED